jgi:hypothetical protein
MKHLLFALPFVLMACGDGKFDAAKAQAAADSARVQATPALDLAAYELPLLLTAPDKQLTGGAEPAIHWRDESGQLEITAGDHFGMAIAEEPGDLARLKADLDRDLLKKNTLLTETPDLLIYRSAFPDDPDLVFVHFYRIVRSGDRSFVIQDLDGKPFNQQDIERMVASVGPKQPA